MKDDLTYLRHILECIRHIEANTLVGHDAFMQSHVLQDATLRNLQTMAEATQRLSEAVSSFSLRYRGSKSRAFRNVLVHNYLGIDMEQIWTNVQRDPTLAILARRA